MASIQVPKFRSQYGLTVAEGTRMIQELLLTAYPYHEAFCTAAWAEAHTELTDRMIAKLTVCSPKEMERMSGMKSPQGVLAIIPFQKSEPDGYCRLSLLCDRISDPGNLGTILRIADWFGAGQVLTTAGSAAFDNPKVIQASMGSWFRVHKATILAKALKHQFRGSHTLYGAVMQGKDLRTVEPDFPAMIVVGNEAEGISDELLAVCNYKVTIPGGIPGVPGASAESLNAAIAASLLCYHFTGTSRQSR
ncbi:MAG TPA: RNA methyltransferase [Bacteroidales bacterium]|nr:RNA methyltransferase [Bacteroidales bacterium]HRZ48737.1 RNA methyltransferase [Bacteroidales bacterium]